MTRVLVTGATGFIGSQVIAPLLERGFEVHAIGRMAPSNGAVVFHKADLLDRHQIERAVSKVRASHLLHLAWYAAPGQFWSAQENLDWVGGSLSLLRAFGASGGRRAVMAGTCAEYAWGPARFHEAGTDRLPATLYGNAKDAVFRVATKHADLTHLSFAWGRVFFLYGPGEKSGRLVSDAIAALRTGQDFPTSEGSQRRDFLHVADAAGAFAALVDSDVQGPVNIGSGAALSVRSVLEEIAQQIGGAHLLKFGAFPLKPGDPPTIEADTSRLRREVGFEPAFDLRLGLADTIRRWGKPPNGI